MTITPQMLDARIEAQSSEMNGITHPDRECKDCAHCKAIAAVRDSPQAMLLICRVAENYLKTLDVGVFAHAYAMGIADGATLAESAKLEEIVCS